MTKTTFLSFSILVLSVFSAQADSIRLGEFQGTLTGTVQYAVPNKIVDVRQTSCTGALNINASATDISIPFSNYTCTDSVFNDPSFTFKIVNSLVYKINAEGFTDIDAGAIGAVQNDGTIAFELKSRSVQNLEITARKAFCGFNIGINKIPYTLNSRVSFTIKQLNEKSFLVSRETANDKIFLVSETLNPNDCEQVKRVLSNANVIGSSSRKISGTLIK